MTLIRAAAFFLALFTGPWAVPGAAADKAPVYVATLAGPVSPGSAAYVLRAVKLANENRAAALVIRLDTPGGLAESMREMVQAILASQTPVVVYVAPEGARAASAGVMITLAADVAAMAEGTNIGAAHPVGAGGSDVGGTMEEKVVSDLAAHARSLAEKRGRNAEWAEKAVRESVSVTATEAVEKNIVDLVAGSLSELLDKVDGMRVNGKVLDTANAPVERMEPTFQEKVLFAVSNPNIAYILLLVGLAGLYFELSNPGAVFPGVIGAVSLVLAFYSLSTLPVNYAGVLLILLSVVFFILEVYVTSYGVLAMGGVVALILGSVMLFDQPRTGIEVSTGVLVSSIGAVIVFVAVVTTLAVRTHLSRPRTGYEGMLGQTGVVASVAEDGKSGKVRVFGELWNADFDQTAAPGDKVTIESLSGLRLACRKNP